MYGNPTTEALGLTGARKRRRKQGMNAAQQRANQRSNWRFNPTATRSESGMVYQSEKLQKLRNLEAKVSIHLHAIELAEPGQPIRKGYYGNPGAYGRGSSKRKIPKNYKGVPKPEVPSTATPEGLQAQLRMNDFRRGKNPRGNTYRGVLPKRYFRVTGDGGLTYQPVHGKFDEVTEISKKVKPKLTPDPVTRGKKVKVPKPSSTTKRTSLMRSLMRRYGKAALGVGAVAGGAAYLAGRSKREKQAA